MPAFNRFTARALGLLIVFVLGCGPAVAQEYTRQFGGGAAGEPLPVPEPGDPRVMGCIEKMNRVVRAQRPAGAPRPTVDDLFPIAKTAAERAALHAEYWPTSTILIDEVARWLQDDFECLEQTFADLNRPDVRDAIGNSKVGYFAVGADAMVRLRGGFTEREIDALMSRWRRATGASLLADLLHPRLLHAAAWRIRGSGLAASVTEQQWAAFKALNRRAFDLLMNMPTAAREHVLWHVVALPIVADNGATPAEVAAFSLDSLKRFPRDLLLPSIAAPRLLPKWGGSPQQLEAYARAAVDATRASAGMQSYMAIYTSAYSLRELRTQPLMRQDDLRQGLIELAAPDSWSGIDWLQSYACVFQDGAALRTARERWKDYASRPQFLAPKTQVPEDCRKWAGEVSR